MQKITYVILANLGGPNKKGEVRNFLFNLFNDKYIIPLPKIPRFLLAHLISFFRAKKSQKEYDKMGGFSPILINTQKQQSLLQKALGNNFKVLIAMSYSPPFMHEVFSQIKAEEINKVILLPLYPQYSITTTKSSAAKFCKTASKYNIQTIDIIPYFFENPKYIASCTRKILNEITKFNDKSKPMVILFSAHGIPKDFVQKWNDPYEQQINKTAFLITQNLKKEGIIFEEKVCFQSRVGPKEWLKPYIQTIIPEYMGYNMIVFPIAFVSEHLETLVELDHQYKELANDCNVYEYRRAETPSECPLFIECLKEEVLRKS